MASAGKRGGAGGRVLEGRHVIGLFLLMLLFSAVFFALGYVMGRNQFADKQVRDASAQPSRAPAAVHAVKPGSVPKTAPPSANPNPPSADQPVSDWEFYNAGSAKPAPDHLLKPASTQRPAAAASGEEANPEAGSAPAKAGVHPPQIPRGAYVLQIAALTKEADALALARALQKKQFPAFVLNPTADHFFRVQVGPYADAQSAKAARRGLESAGFKAILKK
jgi:cell division septation protein DedD